MCRRTDCQYISGMNTYGNSAPAKGGKDRPCAYYMTGKTRLGQLTKKYGLPSNHKKIRKLMSGQHCPFFEPDEGKVRVENPYGVIREMPRKKQKTGGRVAAVLPEDEMMALWKQGRNDAQIARSLGMKDNRVKRWRQRKGLPPNWNFGSNRLILDWEKARELYEQGLSDSEIGKAVGCSNQSIKNWRDREGLVSKNRKYAPKSRRKHG